MQLHSIIAFPVKLILRCNFLDTLIFHPVLSIIYRQHCIYANRGYDIVGQCNIEEAWNEIGTPGN
jgi:hypothetical protein